LTVLAFAAGVLLGYVVWGMGTASTVAANTQANIQNPQTANQAAVPVETLAPTSEPQYVRYDVPSDGFHALGPDDAPITLIEFSDYQCPFCRRWQQEVYQPLLAAYPGKIKLVYRNLPLTSIHPDAFPAAEAAMCAGDQNAYWQYHDKLFTGESLGTEVYKQYAQDLGLDLTAFEDCITNHKFQKAIEDDSNFALNLGVRSTPTFFINGLAIVGAQPLDVFKQVIDKELAGEIP
jgi:protein-disulfide isomerase